MTNEKDMEEAHVHILKPAWICDTCGKIIFPEEEDARIRAEAVQTNESEIAAILLDPAAVYANYLRGTINASEIIKAEVTHRVAEAVKAERERCIIKIRSLAYEGKGMTNYGADKYNEALGDAEDAILSDDQEANRG